MAKLLTKRKEKWVASGKPVSIRGAVLNNPTLLEERFTNKLDAMVAFMCKEIKKDLVKFFREPNSKEYFAEDASISSQARILMNKLMKKYNGFFATMSEEAALRQVCAVNKASNASVQASLKELSGGLTLPTGSLTPDMEEVLKATTAEMAQLIKSISNKYLSEVQGAVMRSIASGNGLADLVPFLEKHKGITERRARMIARDQTRKAYNNLNRGRMEKLGLKKFEWLHTGGSDHPRKLHINYSGKIFSFDDLPIIDENTGERGIPGQAINCRCRMRPVLEFED